MRRIVALTFVVFAWLWAGAQAQSTKQINQLPAASSVNANDVTVIQQGDGVTRQATAQQFVSLYSSVGIYASSIQPITVAEGVFGGTVAYTFPTKAGVPSLIIQGNGLQGNGILELSDTTNTSVSPNKYLRANGMNGDLEVVSSAATNVLFQLNDAGNVYLPQGGVGVGTVAYGNASPASFTINSQTGLTYQSSVSVAGVSCSALDVYQIVSPYATYECTDTAGNVGFLGSAYANAFSASNGHFTTSFPTMYLTSNSTSGTPGSAYLDAAGNFHSAYLTATNYITTPAISLNTYNLPYDPAGDGHWDGGRAASVAGGSTGTVTFHVPFTSQPTFCVASAEMAGTTPTTGIGVVVQSYTGSGTFTGAILKNTYNATMSLDVICKGPG